MEFHKLNDRHSTQWRHDVDPISLSPRDPRIQNRIYFIQNLELKDELTRLPICELLASTTESLRASSNHQSSDIGPENKGRKIDVDALCHPRLIFFSNSIGSPKYFRRTHCLRRTVLARSYKPFNSIETIESEPRLDLM